MLKQLAWAKDPAGVDAAIAALSSPEQKVRAQAATALAEYGLPAAERAKGPLLAALKEAKPESKPQIAWALFLVLNVCLTYASREIVRQAVEPRWKAGIVARTARWVAAKGPTTSSGTEAGHAAASFTAAGSCRSFSSHSRTRSAPGNCPAARACRPRSCRR